MMVLKRPPLESVAMAMLAPSGSAVQQIHCSCRANIRRHFILGRGKDNDSEGERGWLYLTFSYQSAFGNPATHALAARFRNSGSLPCFPRSPSLLTATKKLHTDCVSLVRLLLRLCLRKHPTL